MNILLINGSPRKGNTRLALHMLQDAIRIKHPDALCEFIDIPKHKLQGCINCDSCRKNQGLCAHHDDTNELMNKLMAADILIFGTPVYWWGISGQLKIFIDKLYSRDGIIQEQARKKVGILAFGAGETTDIQYDLISNQFKSICAFLKWELAFSKGFSCYQKNDLKSNASMVEEIVQLADLI